MGGLRNGKLEVEMLRSAKYLDRITRFYYNLFKGGKTERW